MQEGCPYALPPLQRIFEKKQPPQAPAEEDEHRRNQSGKAIASHFQSPAVKQADESKTQNKIFQELGVTRRCASASENCRNEICEKRIGEAGTCECWIVRREVLAVSEAGYDTQMERQIANVIGKASVKAVSSHE